MSSGIAGKRVSEWSVSNWMPSTATVGKVLLGTAAVTVAALGALALWQSYQTGAVPDEPVVPQPDGFSPNLLGKGSCPNPESVNFPFLSSFKTVDDPAIDSGLRSFVDTSYRFGKSSAEFLKQHVIDKGSRFFYETSRKVPTPNKMCQWTWVDKLRDSPTFQTFLRKLTWVDKLRDSPTVQTLRDSPKVQTFLITGLAASLAGYVYFTAQILRDSCCPRKSPQNSNAANAASRIGRSSASTVGRANVLKIAAPASEDDGKGSAPGSAGSASTDESRLRRYAVETIARRETSEAAVQTDGRLTRTEKEYDAVLDHKMRAEIGLGKESTKARTAMASLRRLEGLLESQRVAVEKAVAPKDRELGLLRAQLSSAAEVAGSAKAKAQEGAAKAASLQLRVDEISGRLESIASESAAEKERAQSAVRKAQAERDELQGKLEQGSNALKAAADAKARLERQALETAELGLGHKRDADRYAEALGRSDRSRAELETQLRKEKETREDREKILNAAGKAMKMMEAEARNLRLGMRQERTLRKAHELLGRVSALETDPAFRKQQTQSSKAERRDAARAKAAAAKLDAMMAGLEEIGEPPVGDLT